ncbi:delta-60 repeat domain-containing protein [Nocardia sp. NPDC020380]|uniref:delta-60 repeat domain-containing protein n=1 Tax=Nocardia sp. NPDC020380 TaxID=3364309 RepID=UPI00379842D1
MWCLSRSSRSPLKVLRPFVFVAIAGLAISGCSSSQASSTAPGRLDSSFGSGGKAVTDLGSPAGVANAIAVQSDGKLVLAGSTRDANQGDDFAVVRYTPDGQLDSAFGTGGKVTTDFGGKDDSAVATVLQEDGKIVVAGTSHGTSTGDNIAVARYNPDGKLDSGFGSGGQISTDLGTQADHGNGVVLQNGKIVVGGSTKDPKSGDNFVAVRYTG